jgi:hypothetical protein
MEYNPTLSMVDLQSSCRIRRCKKYFKLNLVLAHASMGRVSFILS